MIRKGATVFDRLTETTVTVTAINRERGDDGQWHKYYNTTAKPCRFATDGWRNGYELSTIKSLPLSPLRWFES